MREALCFGSIIVMLHLHSFSNATPLKKNVDATLCDFFSRVALFRALKRGLTIPLASSFCTAWLQPSINHIVQSNTPSSKKLLLLHHLV